jgi:UDP-N-acetylmuramoyl-L-alanyl-D-glutamate--2,6-diaminopimelate ligase
MDFNELLTLVGSAGAKNKIAVCADSRAVKSGDIFVAVKGTANDGHDFIPKAVEKGAKYIVAQRNKDMATVAALPSGHATQTVIPVEDSAKAWGLLAQAATGNPANKLTNLAVTGTNGKTTITFLVRSIIEAANKKCGLVGTVINDTGKGSVESTMTTPDATTLADMMAQMVENGAKYMIIEASSHALSQSRLEGINFKAAAFTNLTGDHLDYHKDMGNYLSAKTLLFENLAPDGFAILNKQSDASEKIAAKTKAKVLYYAIDEAADIRANVIAATSNETVYDLTYNGKTLRVHSPLLGKHNISNHLAAAGLCLAAGIDLATVVKGLEAMKIVPGRLEVVRCGQEFAVLIDYAHTDDALQNVLSTLQPLCKGKLTVVFGCGGDRDKTKRPRMANVAYKMAGRVIITSDNPRTEQPDQIIADIVAGLPENVGAGLAPAQGDRKGRPYMPPNIIVEPDREKAIGLAIKSAVKDDIILIAGKGHENYQIIGKEKRHFSDREVSEKFLKKT